MLAYRHAFHAGNHADVLKHLVLAQVLTHMAAKDKPYTLVDTHAGAGGYSLEGRYAQKTHESDSGIARLWGRADLPPALAHYVSLVREFKDDTNSIEVRRAIPVAIGECIRGAPVPGEVFETLKAALKSEDADLWRNAGMAIGKGQLTGAQAAALG